MQKRGRQWSANATSQRRPWSANKNALRTVRAWQHTIEPKELTQTEGSKK